MKYSECNYNESKKRIYLFRESIDFLINYTIPVQDGGINWISEIENFSEKLKLVLDPEYIDELIKLLLQKHLVIWFYSCHTSFIGRAIVLSRYNESLKWECQNQ